VIHLAMRIYDNLCLVTFFVYIFCIQEYISMYIYKLTDICVYIHMYIHKSAYVCMHLYTDVLSLCSCVCVYVYMCVYMCMYMCV